MPTFITVLGALVFIGSVLASRRTNRPTVPGFVLGTVLLALGVLLQAT
jgi:hypothetical protein